MYIRIDGRFSLEAIRGHESHILAELVVRIVVGMDKRCVCAVTSFFTLLPSSVFTVCFVRSMLRLGILHCRGFARELPESVTQNSTCPWTAQNRAKSKRERMPCLASSGSRVPFVSQPINSRICFSASPGYTGGPFLSLLLLLLLLSLSRKPTPARQKKPRSELD